jgi:uncharacterized membrane protein (UPF0182 family)
MDYRIPDRFDRFDRGDGGGARRRRLLAPIALLLIVLFTGGTVISYYVEALWFDALGFGSVFWTSLNIQSVVFALFALATFAVLYGSFLALKPASLGEGSVIFINNRPITLPVGPVLRSIALLISIVISVITAGGMMANWMTLALWWYAGSAASLPAAARAADPIFGRPTAFYLFTLPAWQLLAGWLTALAVIVGFVALLFALATGGRRRLRVQARDPESLRAWRVVGAAWGIVLLVFALRTYLSRFDLLFSEHTIFTGVSYTDAHVTRHGLLIIAIALAAGAVMSFANAMTSARIRWFIASAVPALVCFFGTSIVAAYVSAFIVKPNELVRERPFITHNIELTQRAYGLDRLSQRAFPAEAGFDAADAARNTATLESIRLWDWRSLQDTLRQIQEIRTYYDFPDIDIDRYSIDGTVRQMMLAARELSVAKLPVSSRNWINEKLIYTHGYGVTMNPVNGFTPEGLPALVLSNMPVQSTVASLKVTRPEIYFGELTRTDVYVKTRQKEFNYPQGQTNSLTSYEGNGGIVLGNWLRRLAIAIDRGDLAKLPFSDDVTPESRLLMRRTIHDRVTALAPFLTFDSDPYIVIDDAGRLFWMMDAFTTSDAYPYSRGYQIEATPVNYIRNSVKVVVDAYNGTTTFYVFDPEDPIIAAYRRIFPALFKDVSAMPADLRKHVRYPELLLTLQAEVYALYHMTDPEVFYNREDLWAVATEVVMNEQREQATQTMEPNFVQMALPGEQRTEFVEMLPFTPANRNNLIGWIAGRSDDPHYGEIVVYDFPKTKLVDGPLQVEARIDQNAQLSGQLSLWNQQGSRVRRGALLVIPIGRSLLYAQAIYLQAVRSPMPELRLVVLALQDRLAYGPTFDAALHGLFGEPPATTAPAPSAASATASQQPAADIDALIASAAADLADYQRLTAEGKLGEAGQKLEHLKQTLDQLSKQRR